MKWATVNVTRPNRLCHDAAADAAVDEDRAVGDVFAVAAVNVLSCCQ